MILPHTLKTSHLYSHPIRALLKPLFSSHGSELSSRLRYLTISVARELFDEMPVPDYRTCNAMLKNYAANRQHPEVVSLFRWMQDNKVRPDCFALAAAVKSSAVLLNAMLGNSLHGFAVKAGYALSAAVDKALMDMYGRFGMIHESCRIFSEVCHGDPVSWNIMLTTFARAGFHEDAVRLFNEMHVRSHEEVSLTAVTVAVILPICAKMKLLKFGVSIHCHVIKIGLESNTLAGNALVSMYAKCGRVMDDAHKAFCHIICKDVVSWNSIIAGYSENGFFEEALQFFARMVSIGLQPNYATIANILPICAFVEDGTYYGEEVHCYVLHYGLEIDLSICNALLTHYSKVGDMNRVKFLFDKMHSRDIITWNTVIAGYAINGCHKMALDLFHELLANGTNPDSCTFISVLPVFAQLGDVDEGRKIHDYIVQHPKFLQETSLMNALISFYGKCGELDDALLTFESIPKRDLISWNAILLAYADNEPCGKFFDLLNEMNHEGIQPDSVTILSVLRLSTSCGIRLLREVHGYSFRTCFSSETAVVNAIINAYANCGNTNYAYKTFKSFTGKNVVTGNTMISGYMKHGFQEDAEMIFGQMSQRDLTTWNLMVQVYSQSENTDRAFTLFNELQQEGIKPDAVSVTSILPACICLTSIHLVRQCHGYMLRSLTEDIHIEGALLDAYSKCGNTSDAYNLFKASPLKDLVTFTAMVGGYAMHGMTEEAIRIFSEMLELNIKPDHIIMTALLSACSHAGMVDEGWKLFKSIREIHGIEPTTEHYACMVDLLARGGRLREGYDFILDMPFEANASMWSSLLGGCKTHKEVEVARLVADHLFSVEAENIGNYVIMSNIYAADERWDSVEQVRRLMKSKDLKKPAGCSWIEVEKTRHLFVAGDLCHPKRLIIYNILKTLDQQIKDPFVQRNQ